jgi:hypothetical protein
LRLQCLVIGTFTIDLYERSLCMLRSSISSHSALCISRKRLTPCTLGGAFCFASLNFSVVAFCSSSIQARKAIHSMNSHPRGSAYHYHQDRCSNWTASHPFPRPFPSPQGSHSEPRIQQRVRQRLPLCITVFVSISISHRRGSHRGC